LFTTILAYGIGLMGVATIAAGAWSLMILLSEQTVRVPLRYYSIAIAMISGGLGLVGLAQALRLLLVINGSRG
jgi:hypothetical protein